MIGEYWEEFVVTMRSKKWNREYITPSTSRRCLWRMCARHVGAAACLLELIGQEYSVKHHSSNMDPISPTIGGELLGLNFDNSLQCSI